jgi:hypothetical protein
MAKRYKYSWAAERGVFTKLDAQTVGEWYYSLPSRDPEFVIKEARKPSCPIHSALNWDDKSAATRHRMHQLQMTIASLKVEIVNKQKKTEHIRAFIKSVDTGFNVPTVEATDEDLSAVEQEFLERIEKIRLRYASLSMARPVIHAIDLVRRSNNLRGKRKLKLVS